MPRQTLLREIQGEAADANGDVGALLRKCKILAARLKRAEFAQWLSWELQGYPDGQSLPDYRNLSVQYYANFLNAAWNANRQPLAWPLLGVEAHEKCVPIRFRDGVAKAQALVKGASIPRPDLGFLVEGKMYPDMNCVGVWAEIAGNEFQQRLSTVRTRVLDFALKIEVANPDAGEAEADTAPISADKLQPIINNFFHGDVGNVAQNNQYVSQNAQLGITAKNLTEFTGQFRAHLAELNLTPKDTKRVDAQLQTIDAQLADEPNPVILREAGRSIRNITEQAIGGLVAAAATNPSTWTWIQSVLAQLAQ